MEAGSVRALGHNRPVWSGKALLLPLLLVAFLLLPLAPARALAHAPAHVTYLALAAQSTQPPQAIVDEQSAVPHFPDTVDFRLRAHGFETARAELNYRLVGEPVTAGLQAEVAAITDSPDLALTLDLATHYIPPGSEVEYYWTLTASDGRTTDTPTKTFKLLDERHAWKSLSDAQKRVSVHWYRGNAAFGEKLVGTAAGALNRLQNDIQAGLQRPAEIWMYATQDDLLDALPKNIPEWVGGKAFPELALVLAAVGDDEMANTEIKRVIPHELSHLVLYQATRNPYNSPPAWFDEGLAVYNQQAHDPAEDEALQYAAKNGSLIPLKSLSGSFGADEEAAALSYAESRSAVDFLLSDPRYGPSKFAATVEAFRQGVTYDEALKAGLGATVEEIDTQWRISLPYKQGAGRAAPAPPSDTKSAPFRLSPTSPLVLIPATACALLFLAGGALTLVLLVRRRQV